MKLFFRFGFLVLVYCTHCIDSHSNGAPRTVCTTMTPNHGSSPQNGPSPYTMQPSTNIKAGETVKVTLGTAGGPSFRGFFSIGTKKGTTEPVGTMLLSGGDDVKIVDCTNGKGVTHTGSTEKTTVTFEWTAPNEPGDYVILTTFVKNQKTYWVAQSSTEIGAAKERTSTSAQDRTAATSFAALLLGIHIFAEI